MKKANPCVRLTIILAATAAPLLCGCMASPGEQSGDEAVGTAEQAVFGFGVGGCGTAGALGGGYGYGPGVNSLGPGTYGYGFGNIGLGGYGPGAAGYGYGPGAFNGYGPGFGGAFGSFGKSCGAGIFGPGSHPW